MSKEVDAIDFVNRATSTSNERSSEYVLEHESGAELTVELRPVDRKKLLDEIGRLPDEMLETLSEAEDEEEAQELAEEQNMLSGVNGNTVLAFENICAESFYHDDLTSHHYEDLVSELDFETLFEIGSEVIEMSFENTGSIKDFHEVDSDKSS